VLLPIVIVEIQKVFVRAHVGSLDSVSRVAAPAGDGA
jgi:hypothetical protein